MCIYRYYRERKAVYNSFVANIEQMNVGIAVTVTERLTRVLSGE